MRARRASELATSAAGARAVPLNLIHTNNSPNPALARVSSRFDLSEGVPVGAVFDALRMPSALAFLMLRRMEK